MSGTAKPLNALLSASMDCLLVLVVSARPVIEVAAAPVRCPVEQLPARVQRVRATVVGRVRVVDRAVLQRERAQAVQLRLPHVEAGRPWGAEVEPGPRAPLLLGEHGEV